MNTAIEILEYYIKKKKKFWTVPECMISAWYKEARVLDLACTYEDFAWLIKEETTTLYHKYHSYYARRKNRRPLNENDRGTPHSVVGWGEKKVLSEEEILKREWKKKKKNRRDQGSTLDYRGGWTCLQKTSNKKERRKIKVKMQSGNWEAYGKTQWEGEDQMTPVFPENDWDNYVHPTKRECMEPWDYY